MSHKRKAKDKLVLALPHYTNRFIIIINIINLLYLVILYFVHKQRFKLFGQEQQREYRIRENATDHTPPPSLLFNLL